MSVVKLLFFNSEKNRNAFAGVHFIHFPVLRVACELQLNPSSGLCNQQFLSVQTARKKPEAKLLL